MKITPRIRFLFYSLIMSGLCTYQVHPASFNASSWFEHIQKPFNTAAAYIKKVNSAYIKPALNSVQTFCKKNISQILVFSAILLTACVAMSKRKKDGASSTPPNYTVHTSKHQQKGKKNFEIIYLSVQEQTGDYCGYHTAYNAYNMLLHSLGDKEISWANYQGFNEKDQLFEDMKNSILSKWRKTSLKKDLEKKLNTYIQNNNSLEKTKKDSLQKFTSDIALGLSNSTIEQLYGLQTPTTINELTIPHKDLIDTFAHRLQSDDKKDISPDDISTIFKNFSDITINKDIIGKLHPSHKISPLQGDDIRDLIIALIQQNRTQKEVLDRFSAQDIDEYITSLDDVSTFNKEIYASVFKKWAINQASHIFLIGDMETKNRDKEGHWIAMLACKNSCKFYVANSKESYGMEKTILTVINQLTK